MKSILGARGCAMSTKQHKPTIALHNFVNLKIMSNYICNKKISN